MYSCAYDLNEAPNLENIGEISFKYNGYSYSVIGIIQDPQLDLGIEIYLGVLKSKKDLLDFSKDPNDFCRISIGDPKYIDSEYDIDKFRLSNDEISKLIEILSKEYYDSWNFKQYNSFWEYILNEYSDRYGIDVRKLKMPDYMKLIGKDM